MSAVGAAAGAWLAGPAKLLARPPAAARVAVGMCADYNAEVTSTLQAMFDRLGGLEGMVRGKTVAIKLNLTGVATDRMGHMPQGITHWVHPEVVGAAVHLLGKAGAKRIRLLESPWNTAEPLEEFLLQANWEPRDFLSAAPLVEFENTNYLGNGKKYSRFWVPGGGLMCKGYDLNHSYEDCDVFVSLAKLKEHVTTGVTLSMKNCFGIIPCTIYGDGCSEDGPSLIPKGGRGLFHDGNRLPSKSAPPLLNATVPKDGGYRVPRVVADLVAARPIHLGIIDGIQTISGGEYPFWLRPWGRQVQPHLLIAGLNCVATDAVSMALMGFDPMADRGTAPFETCDSTLRLAEQLGVGTRDLDRIEVVGTPIAKARFNFRRA